MYLVIDCHSHFTTEPEYHHEFRRAQVAHAEGRGEKPVYPGIPHEELRAIIANQQLRIQSERGSDVTILSPRASGMGHHVGDVEVAKD